MLELNIAPAGLLLITRLDPKNKILEEQQTSYAVFTQSLDLPPLTILHPSDKPKLGDASYKEFVKKVEQLKP